MKTPQTVPNPTEPAPRYYVQLTEEQAIDLASNFVPSAVKALVLTMLDQNRIDERRAARPVQKKKKAS